MLKKIARIVLFAVGVALPLEAVGKVFIGVFTLTPVRAITAVALLFAILDMVLSGPRVPRSSKNLWVLAFFVALVIGCVYGSLYSGLPPLIYVLKWTRFGSVLLFYLVLCQLVTTRRDLDAFLGGFVVGGTLAAISAFTGDVEWSGETERRAGFGGGANQHAGNLLTALPLAYALFFSVRQKVLKPMLVTAVLIMSAGVVAAASRSAFLAALGMGGVWMMRFRRPSDLKYVIAMALVIVVGVFAAPRAYMSRIATIKDAFASLVSGDSRPSPEVEIGNRVEVMRAAVGAFVSSPFGAGVGNFGPWAVKNGYKMPADVSVHNAVLQVGAELGIVGVVPYLAIVVMTWTQLSRARRLANRFRVLGDTELAYLGLRAVMVQIGFIGIAVVAQFQPGMIWKGMWGMFGISTALLGVTERRIRQLRALGSGEETGTAYYRDARGAEPARG